MPGSEGVTCSEREPEACGGELGQVQKDEVSFSEKKPSWMKTEKTSHFIQHKPVAYFSAPWRPEAMEPDHPEVAWGSGNS